MIYRILIEVIEAKMIKQNRSGIFYSLGKVVLFPDWFGNSFGISYFNIKKIVSKNLLKD